MSSDTTTKAFLQDLEKRFAKSEKSEISTLLASLVSMRYKGNGNIKECVMEIYHLASKLKALKLDLSEDLMLYLVLISLPAQFNQFNVSYNYQKETWSLNEIISYRVQEEERLKQDKTESAHHATTSKDKRKKRKDKEAADTQPPKKQQKNPSDSQSSGSFYLAVMGI